MIQFIRGRGKEEWTEEKERARRECGKRKTPKKMRESERQGGMKERKGEMN